MIRALFFQALSDPQIWNWPYEYMLGDDLLVATVVESGARAWCVYLPQGDWVSSPRAGEGWSSSLNGG